MSRVAVIGAGIAGLTCAFELWRVGVEVAVFEREPSVGGRMRTRNQDHLAFDIGANFLVRAYQNIHRLTQELGVAVRDASPVSHIVYRGGKPCPMNFSSIRDVFRMEGLNLWSRARFLAFVLRIRREHPHLDFFDLSQSPDELNQEDAYSYARREVTQEFADYILDAFNSCMMFHRSNEISVVAFLSLFSMMADPAFDFSVLHAVGDMQAIPEALAGPMPVQRGCPVLALEPSANGWWVTTPGSREHYGRVVLATTAGAGRELLQQGPHQHLELLSQTRYASTINVSFRIPRQALGHTHCFYVPFVENQIISEFTNEALKGKHTTHEGWSLVNVGLHEAAALKLLEASDDQVFDTVGNELLKLNWDLGCIPGEVLAYDLQRWPEAIPKYDCAQVARVKQFLRSGQGLARLYLCGDYLNSPWIEGASRSGQKVAASILRELGAQ